MIQFYIFIIHILYSILRNTDCQEGNLRPSGAVEVQEGNLRLAD